MTKYSQEVQNYLRAFFKDLEALRPDMKDMNVKLVAELEAEVKNPDVFLPQVVGALKKVMKVGVTLSKAIVDLVENPSEVAELVSITNYESILKEKLDDDVVLMAEEALAFKTDAESELVAKFGSLATTGSDPLYAYVEEQGKMDYFIGEMVALSDVVVEAFIGE